MARACQNDIGGLNIRNKESPEGDGNLARACQNDIGRLNIRNKESPEGDGNFYSYFSVEHIKLEIKKAPKGTETKILQILRNILHHIRNKESPEGDGTKFQITL